MSQEHYRCACSAACVTRLLIAYWLPKTRLPASRDLAKEIQVSRNTVLNAYEQLQAQGYVDARTGQGTWVVEKLPESFW